MITTTTHPKCQGSKKLNASTDVAMVAHGDSSCCCCCFDLFNVGPRCFHALSVFVCLQGSTWKEKTETM